MTSDPTASDHDTDTTHLEPGNVDPPGGVSGSAGDEAQDGEAPSEGDGDVAPTGEAVLDES